MSEFSDRIAACRMKIARCDEHLKTFETEVLAFVAEVDEGQVYQAVPEFEPDTGYTSNRIHLLQPIPAQRWGVLLGDAVHNARSALDNAVTALVRKSGGEVRRNTEFPVYHSEEHFLHGPLRRDGTRGVSGLDKIRGVGAAATEIIRKAQPYQMGENVLLKPYRSDPLWILHELWIMDKHREIPVLAMGARFAGGPIKTRYRSVDGLTATYRTGRVEIEPTFRLEEGAQINRMIFDISVNTEMQVEYKTAIEIVLGDGTPGAQIRVDQVMAACVGKATRLVAEFEALA